MSGTPITIYCCGTNFDLSNRGELIADLFHATTSSAWIVAGPGSRTRSSNMADRFIGLADGAGHIDGAVDALMRKLAGTTARPSHLNLIGWSRGAITCNALAYRLARDPKLSGIPLNIFAVDPVPGPSNFHTRFLQISGNVRAYTAIFMQNELRAVMVPGEPRIVSSSTRYRYLNFPGRHSDGVITAEGFEEVSLVVRHLAEQFLGVRGTRLIRSHLLSRQKLVESYSEMILKTRDYFEGARLLVGSKWASRSIKGIGVKNTLENHLSQGDGYFVNPHHRHEWSQSFPMAHDYYFTNAVIRRSTGDQKRNFGFRTRHGQARVLAELEQMRGRFPKTYQTLGMYQWIQEDLQGDAKAKRVRSFGREATCVDPISLLKP